MEIVALADGCGFVVLPRVAGVLPLATVCQPFLILILFTTRHTFVGLYQNFEPATSTWHLLYCFPSYSWQKTQHVWKAFHAHWHPLTRPARSSDVPSSIATDHDRQCLLPVAASENIWASYAS